METAGYLRLAFGLAAVVVLAMAARVGAGVLPTGVSEVTVGLILGLLFANLLLLPSVVATGARFAASTLLRLGIVLLGAGLGLADVAAVGMGGLLAVVAAMLIALAVSLGLGRLLNLPASITLLVGVGTAICGNSAIAATAPLIEAKRRDVGLAMGTITLFGTLGVVLYPAIGRALSLPDAVFGPWAGIAVSDTAQATATGFAYSQGAGESATIVKLIRNGMMAPAIVLIGIWWAASGRSTRPDAPAGMGGPKLLTAVPLFMLGFVCMVVLNTVGLIPEPIERFMSDAARAFILMAMVGVGLTTRMSDMRRLGARVLCVGFLAAAASSLFALSVLSLWSG